MRVRIYLGLVIFFLALPIQLYSETGAVNGKSPSKVPSEKDPFQIRLVTFSPHQSIFAWYGHSAIEVVNTNTGNAHLFNFGGFSFDYQHLAEFIFGRFEFWNFVLPTSRALVPYRLENRHIVFQELNLTAEQKKYIRQRLVQYLKPQNRYYIYDHFIDNCSTKIRDVIDDALAGKLKSQTMQIDDLTFRQYIHRMMVDEPLLDFGLNFILNDSVDKPITRWDSMFLPDRLMMVVQSSQTPNLSGEMQSPLVKKRIDHDEGAGVPFYTETVEPVNTVLREILWGVFLLVIMIVSAIFYIKKVNRIEKIYPTLISLFGLIFGMCGSILFFMMCFTEHKDTYWNENILLLNPITFLLFPLGIAHVFGGLKVTFCRVSALCGFFALLALLLKIVPMFDQSNAQQLRVLLPALLTIGLVGVLGLRKPKNLTS